MRHWSREGPPAYIAVAAYLGLRSSHVRDSEVLHEADLLNFLAVFPGGEKTSKPGDLESS
jgi:hypothetical protein